MHRLFPHSMLVALASLACDQPPTQPDSPPASTPASQAKTSGLPEFDPKNFVRRVNNPYFPLRPGTRFVYTGMEDGEPRKVVVDVTYRKKTILGIQATVVQDRSYVNGSLVENTYDWYAQDEDGNVWYLGEYSREIEDGAVVSTEGSWEAGKNGARAGIIMLARPRVGRRYPQERSPGVAEGRARVLGRGQTISVPYGKWRNCLRIEEWDPQDPAVRELKFYCPRIGLVKGRTVRGGTDRFGLLRIRL